MNNQLRPELLSLLHYVELNKSGWWNKAAQQIILAVVWLAGRVERENDITDLIKSTFNIDVPFHRIDSSINTLIKSGSLIKQDDGSIIVGIEKVKTLESRLGEATKNEALVKEKFVKLLESSCPSIEPESCWKSFNDEYLIHLIKKSGAKSYALISGQSVENGAIEYSFSGDFFNKYDKDIKMSMRSVVDRFLDPKDASVRIYILSHLQAYFLVQSSNLSEEVLDKITKLQKNKPSFDLFLDTNFLFSVLELHENPSNEASKLLIHLLKSTSKYINVKLYIHPLTIDEAKRVLSAVKHDFKGIRLNTAVARAASDMGLSGVSLRFVNKSKLTPKGIDPDEYFDPYLKHFATIAKQKSIEVYNEKFEQYLTRQDVIDDISDKLGTKIQGKIDPELQAAYKAAEHDIVLWYTVKDHRPSQFENIVDAKYWIVTNDYGFIRHDNLKISDQCDTSICLHPSELIQMLQIWEPTTPDLEEALIGSFKLPLLFYEYDHNAEKITLRMLKAISRFENLDDLDSETISEILTDDGLRNNIASAVSEDEDLSLIREELFNKNKELNDKLDISSSMIEALKEELSSEKSERIKLQGEISDIKQGIADQQTKSEAQKVFRLFFIKWIVVPSVIGVAITAAISLVLWHFAQFSLWKGLISVGLICGLIWLWLIEPRGNENNQVSTAIWFVRLCKFKKVVFGISIPIILGLIGRAIWELF